METKGNLNFFFITPSPHYHLVRSRSNPAGANLTWVVFVRIFVALTVSGRKGYRDRR